MDAIIDTQILSYHFKGSIRDSSLANLSISSITANEFLLAQPGVTDKADYYVIHPDRYPCLRWGNAPEQLKNPKFVSRGADRTDQLIIDFGTEFLPYREFGNEAISEVINKGLVEIYKISVSPLSKEKQKYLLKRMKYILDNELHCYPLNPSVIELALQLFSKFSSRYNCKQKVRNTINDILILATAIKEEKVLRTSDSLLNRFAANYYEATIQKLDNNIAIDFSNQTVVEVRRNRESKEYINKGWSYALRRK